MPVSAYRGGQLKKNPLQGTALGVDTSRAGERERFQSLHEEAKGMAGKGRAGMESSLANRYARFAEPNQAALGQLGGQYRALQTEAEGVRDSEKEAGFAKSIGKAKSNIDKLSFGHEKYKGRPQSHRNIPKGMKQDFKKGEYKSLSFGERIKYKRDPEAYLKKKYAAILDTEEEREQDYQNQVDARIDALQDRGAPIAADMERRTGALHQRIADYNLFLGQA